MNLVHSKQRQICELQGWPDLLSESQGYKDLYNSINSSADDSLLVRDIIDFICLLMETTGYSENSVLSLNDSVKLETIQ